MAAQTDKPSQHDVQPETVGEATPGTPQGQTFAALALGALGVVYGDIGTSPIYALHVCFTGDHSVRVSTGAVLGILSLVFWTLVLTISLKYMTFVLRQDNRGEGGIFALLSLLATGRGTPGRMRRGLLLLGLAGAAMLFGDAMITPAISVLSAMEGLRLATPALAPWVVPITVATLVALFALQGFGTRVVGFLFGPVMLVWFLTIAALGLYRIFLTPQILRAIDPGYAVSFLRAHGASGYLVLGGVFLVTTGGEALYADLGHFGRQPIVRAWFALVLPALLLNYFGQGAFLLTRAGQDASLHPFFDLAPLWGLPILIALAALATCIASQAAITGAFSLTRQAIQLGQLPQLKVRQTSAEARGQIYLPTVNWLMMAGALVLVLAFRSSAGLAGAYGVAVNSAMVVTTMLAFTVGRERRGWSVPAALGFLALFLAVDVSYLGANYVKVPEGGWLPLVVGVALLILMTTWKRGTVLLEKQISLTGSTLETFLGSLAASGVTRLPGTAVFFSGSLEQTPPALRQLLRHTGVLYERVLLVAVLIEQVPRITADERIDLEALDQGFYRIRLRYGFMQTPNVPSELAACAKLDLDLELDQLHYIVGRVDTLAGRKAEGMARWRDRLFGWMARNTEDVTVSYQLPAAQTMTVGLRIGI